MLSGADLRQVLQAGLWEALADGSDRAAMRTTCRDARDMVDALHDTAIIPVGPATWYSGGAIAAYHRQLGAIRSLHVVYSGGGEEDEARAAHFMEAYSTALGAALHATDCSVAVPCKQQLPAPLAAVLLQRVAPRVERLDMALGSYSNLVQLLQALEPCARLCSLRLLPMHAAEAPGLDDQRDVCIWFQYYPGARVEYYPGALEALCRLPRLHTLSGPWGIEAPHLQRLCDALPSLTTLGFKHLSLQDAQGACISRRLHTLAAWCHSSGHDSLRVDQDWHNSTCYMSTPCNLQAALPAVQHLNALVLRGYGARATADELHAIQAVAQRCAACADRWAWQVTFQWNQELQFLRGMPPGSLSALLHLDVFLDMQDWGLDPDMEPLDVASADLAPADVASALCSLVSAAPNITTLAIGCGFVLSSSSAEVLTAVMQPFRRAAHLRTLRLYGAPGDYDDDDDDDSDNGDDDDDDVPSTAARQAALLEGVVRGLAQPGAEDGDEYCRALRHVLLDTAQPDALAACRAALARDGICVAVDRRM